MDTVGYIAIALAATIYHWLVWDFIKLLVRLSKAGRMGQHHDGYNDCDPAAGGFLCAETMARQPTKPDDASPAQGI